MSSKSVELLLQAVARLQADVAWLKRGMIGIYATVGVSVVTLFTSLLMHK
jgi:hypothetical protein